MSAIASGTADPRRHSAGARVGRRRPRMLLVPLALGVVAAGLVAGSATAQGSTGVALRTAVSDVTAVELGLPAGMDPSEPHLAVDPRDPRQLFAVVQAVSAENP